MMVLVLRYYIRANSNMTTVDLDVKQLPHTGDLNTDTFRNAPNTAAAVQTNTQ